MRKPTRPEDQDSLLRRERRLSVWCAVNCAGDGLWTMPTPVPSLSLLKGLKYRQPGRACQGPGFQCWRERLETLVRLNLASSGDRAGSTVVAGSWKDLIWWGRAVGI